MTYKLDERQILFGSYFYLSDVKFHHERSAYTVYDLISDLGGFFGLMNSFFFLIGASINT